VKEVKQVINVDYAWRKGITGDGVIVAVLDTGSGRGHPDLEPATAAEYNFTDSPTAEDVFGHATHVGGIIAGRGVKDADLKGIASGAKIVWIKVLNDEGWGYTDWILAGLEKAIEVGAHVVNLSLGGFQRCDGSDVLSRAASELWERYGIIVLAAAGNCGRDCLNAPAIGKQVVSVGACDKAFKLADFSSRGHACDSRWIPSVYGVGVDVCSCQVRCQKMWHWAQERYRLCNQWYARWSGTSMATPCCAGAAALALEYTRKLGNQEDVARDLARESLKLCGTEFGTDVEDEEGGRKCVDVRKMFEYVWLKTPKETAIVDFVLVSGGDLALEGEVLEIEEGHEVELSGGLTFKDPETREWKELGGYRVEVRPFGRWLLCNAESGAFYWKFWPSAGEYDVKVVFPGADVYKSCESGVIKLVVRKSECKFYRAIAEVWGSFGLWVLRQFRVKVLRWREKHELG